MSQDLISIMGSGLVEASKYGTELAHKAVAGSSFLPRLQLFQAGSGPCKKGKAPIGTFAIVRGKDTILHLLGEETNALVISWRPKALRFAATTLLTYFNPSSPKFKQVEIDSTKKDSGCMFGPEYLLYVPCITEFVTMHFNNPTMRVAAAGMLPNIGRAITLKVEYIEKGKLSWHGPVVLNCSTPLTTPKDAEAFRMELITQRNKFNNPKEDEELEAAPQEQNEVGRDR